MKNIDDHESIHNINLLYFVIDKVDGYSEGGNENQSVVFASSDKNKKLLKKCTKLQDGIKNLIERLNDKPGGYGKDFMKTKFNSDDDFPLNKILKLQKLTFVRSVFEEDVKYYPQILKNECLLEL